MPFPLVMVALTVLCSLLPFDGTALICGPLTLYLFWAAAPWKAIMLAVWGTVVVVGMVDNVLKQMLIGRGTHVPTLFLFFSIVGGLAAYGFIGMFVGPVVLAVLLTALVFMKKIMEQDGKRPRKRPCNAEELGRPLGERDRSVVEVSNCEQTCHLLFSYDNWRIVPAASPGHPVGGRPSLFADFCKCGSANLEVFYTSKALRPHLCSCCAQCAVRKSEIIYVRRGCHPCL